MLHNNNHDTSREAASTFFCIACSTSWRWSAPHSGCSAPLLPKQKQQHIQPDKGCSSSEGAFGACGVWVAVNWQHCSCWGRAIPLVNQQQQQQRGTCSKSFNGRLPLQLQRSDGLASCDLSRGVPLQRHG